MSNGAVVMVPHDGEAHADESGGGARPVVGVVVVVLEFEFGWGQGREGEGRIICCYSTYSPMIGHPSRTCIAANRRTNQPKPKGGPRHTRD